MIAMQCRADRSGGGAAQSRTGLRGFAILCITALLPRPDRRDEKGKPELPFSKYGAGEESRTLDLNLGKVALYQLSYSRVGHCALRQRRRGPEYSGIEPASGHSPTAAFSGSTHLPKQELRPPPPPAWPALRRAMAAAPFQARSRARGRSTSRARSRAGSSHFPGCPAGP